MPSVRRAERRARGGALRQPAGAADPWDETMKAELICSATLLALPAAALAAGPAPDQNHGLRGTALYDRALYVAFCPRGSAPGTRHEPPESHEADRWRASSEPAPEPESPAREEEEQTLEPEAPAASRAPATYLGTGTGRERLARAASTSEAGWPAKQCLKMDKGQAGRRHTLVGLNGVHNWLLGGYGNDTIIGGDNGDVIWADYHPSGEPRSQTALIRAGNGRNVIYANDTHNYVWTGTNPRTVVHAHVSGISGVIHCQSPEIVVYLSVVSERHFTLDGCTHVSHYSVGY
jgi:hypothetical protein